MLEWFVSSAVLSALVIALRFLLKGKISLRLQYLLWLPVLLRLLLPGSIGASEFSVGNLTQKAAQTEAVQTVSALSELALPQKSYRAAYEEVAQEYAEQGIDIEKLPISEYESVDYEIMARMSGELTLRRLCKLIWLAGVFTLAGVLLFSDLRFAEKLKKARREMDIEGFPLPVFISPVPDTPCLFGLLRPAVYLTEEAVADETALRHSLCHELTHYRHGDHIWGLLRGVCLALHWYDPLVWWAAALSRKDCELACDEAAVKALGESERAAYGRTLIAMSCEKRQRLLLTATTMSGGRSLKERITLLAKKPKTAFVTLIAVLLVISVAAGCSFTGAEKSRSSLTPDTVTLCQYLSSGPPCPPITDAEAVAHLWELYQDFTFDGTTEEIGRENAWSICVSFTDSATGESESFTIFQGGLCTLGGDLETYHILHDGAALYREFLQYYKMYLPAAESSPVQISDPSNEVLLLGFSAEAEGNFEEIGRQWAEAFASQYVDLPPEHPLYSRSAAVLHCSLNMESLLSDPKALVFGMSFACDAANADAFARCYVDAEPLADAAYPQYAGWMRFGCFVALKDSGNGKWSCIDAGSGGYGGWGYLNYDEVDQVDFRMNSMLAGEEDIPENLLRVLPFVDLTRLSADKREKLFAFLDRYCLSEGQVYGPEESRLWKDVYPEDQSYRDLYVMLAALNAEGKCSEDFSAILQKQRRYDPASFESSLGALTQAQRKGIEKLLFLYLVISSFPNG